MKISRGKAPTELIQQLKLAAVYRLCMRANKNSRPENTDSIFLEH